jgi:hypothetical protein
MKRLALFLYAALAAFGQTAINQVSGPPPSAYVDLYFYDASNLQYNCRAPQNVATTSWTIAATTITNIVDASNTSTVTTSAAHGLYPGARVVIKGATVDVDLDGAYTVLTTPLATTFTVTTANVSDATYTDAGLVITTKNPVTTASVWAIKAYTYSSGVLSGSYWATGATTAARLKCSERANY